MWVLCNRFLFQQTFSTKLEIQGLCQTNIIQKIYFKIFYAHLNIVYFWNIFQYFEYKKQKDQNAYIFEVCNLNYSLMTQLFITILKDTIKVKFVNKHESFQVNILKKKMILIQVFSHSKQELDHSYCFKLFEIQQFKNSILTKLFSNTQSLIKKRILLLNKLISYNQFIIFQAYFQVKFCDKNKAKFTLLAMLNKMNKYDKL
ncbi:unnamed protein product [Paramecium sonneborni]|uniref:Uncharacterized protein n=1 Tax=Paramecium sonneborni TaxID=65129 RepID=A0A8S1L0Y0_9CILI|nr:unnamed protein product [Paramecium sonneborni]